MRIILIALSVVSGAAMLYVGAYQIRAVEHMSCPLLTGGCEAVADAPFARPFGIPDGFIATGLYALIIATAWFFPQARYVLRGLAVLAALANALGVFDMARFGAFCFYCLLTTLLAPFLVWAAFRL